MTKNKLERIWRDYPCANPSEPMRWYPLLLLRRNLIKYFSKFMRKGKKDWSLFKN